ncbi:serine hydrolase [Terrabacter aeriphilus]|uniref:Serine hydrolase n=1 Tax=Terrabacter aeriphilus TaxID=515662 RepID=A0ABP9JF30_9MICO
MGPVCRRVPRLAAIVVVSALLAYLGTLAAVRGPVAAYRMATNGRPSVDTWRIFPQRSVESTGVHAALATSPMPTFPETVAVPDFFDVSQKRVARWSDLFAQTNARAFVVVHDDAVVYEAYPNGAHRDDVQPGFSVTKSFMSTLIGIAIHDGRIRRVDDPVVGYLPELLGRGLDDLRIRDLLTMSSGVGFDQVGAVFPLLAAFSDDPRVYYSPDLRSIALGVRAGAEPVAQALRYNDYYLLLEGIILERVTGQSLTSYLSAKLWSPLQMEFPASWSLDSDTDGFEKPEAGLNARALDFARLGLLYLHDGRWAGAQVVPSGWVRAATVPDAGDTRPWLTAPRWKELGYYGYHWWGLRGADGHLRLHGSREPRPDHLRVARHEDSRGQAWRRTRPGHVVAVRDPRTDRRPLPDA